MGRRGARDDPGRWTAAARERPTQPFVVRADSSECGTAIRSLSYASADALSTEFARWLVQEGRCARGETVALLMGTSCEFVVAFLGCVKAGTRAALLNVSRGVPLNSVEFRHSEDFDAV